MLLSSAGLLPAATVPNSHKHAPDEIIVKFRPYAAAAIEALAPDPASRSRPNLPNRLRQLTAQGELTELRPIIRGLRRQHSGLHALRTTDPRLLTPRQRRLLDRLGNDRAARAASGLDRVYRIKLAQNRPHDLALILDAYRSSPDVEYAELNYVVREAVEPDDPRYSAQWPLHNIAAAEAWDTCKGSPAIIVAVIDTGIDYTHRDIADNIWLNDAELNGLPGADDDLNGYVDDIRGYNMIYNNNDPTDDRGHGTHVAGIVAAIGDNGLDVAGVAWNVKVMPVKFLGTQGEGTVADAAEALYYAAANSANVICNSWGMDSKSQLIEDALDYAYRQGAVLIAAAGNDAGDGLVFPAGYDNVIGVAAVGDDDRKSLLSNYGDWVDIAAPGVDILSLRAKGTALGQVVDDFTMELSGTSMATPHVAGVCALMLSANPLLTPYEVRRIITETGDEIEAGICASDARVNAANAIRSVVPPLGDVRLDRYAYALGGDVGILLADWHLRGQGSQWVRLTTRRGDSETVVLPESDFALGVFTGRIKTEANEPPNPENGVIEVAHGDVIGVDYWDQDDGAGAKARRVANAAADYVPPDVVHLEAQARGRRAMITVVTNEPTFAAVRCGPQCADVGLLTVESPEMTIYHELTIQPLDLQTEYHFIIDLIDQAGNQATLDNNGLCYTFATDANFPGFNVPANYPTIQEAIDDAWDGDTVWLADGTYTGQGNIDIDFKGKAITLAAQSGDPNECIIDCQSQSRAFDFHNGETQDSVLDSIAVIHGGGVSYGGALRCAASSPTIRNCIFFMNSSLRYGGAIYNSYGSHPAIRDCQFEANTSTAPAGTYGNGGAIANRVDSNPVILRCTFHANSANFSGGAVLNTEDCSPEIRDCRFTGNTAGYEGGALANWKRSKPAITGCTFTANTADDDGGAVTNHSDSAPQITNCIFNENLADSFGGAAKNYEATLTLTKCTLAFNLANWSCGGIYNAARGRVVLANCILWGNTDNQDTPEGAQLAGEEDWKIDYCCVQGWTGTLGGIGNLDLDPLFADPNNDDFHLKSRGWRWDPTRLRWDYDDRTSPLIDAGNPGAPLGDEPLAVPDDPSNRWGVNLRINLGAYGATAEASMAPLNWALLADLTNNGVVNLYDLALTGSDWGAAAGPMIADFNRDGAVNKPDLALLAADWLKHVRPAWVRIVQPANGDVIRLRATDELAIPIVAEAADLDGPVLRVEFFCDGQIIGQDQAGADGWRMIWIDFPTGEHTLTARAVVKNGLPATSPRVNIAIATPR